MTVHHGVQMLVAGDSHMIFRTVNQSDGYAKIAGYGLSTSNLPIEPAMVSVQGQSDGIWLPFLYEFLQMQGGGGIVVIPAGSAQAQVVGTTPSYSQTSQLQQMVQAALAWNAKPIIVTDYARASRDPVSVGLAAAVGSGATSATLSSFAPTTTTGGPFAVTGSPTALTAGTTITLTQGNNAATFNQALPALSTNEILSMNAIPNSTVTSGSHAVTLGVKAPFAFSGAIPTDSGNCIPTGNTITTTLNSTSATLAGTLPSSTCSANDTITIITSSPTTEANRAVTNAYALELTGLGSSVQVFDTTCLMDNPTDPGYMINGTSWDGLHTNDNYMNLLAVGSGPCRGFESLLIPMLRP